MPSGIAIDGTNVKTEVPQHTVSCLLLEACIHSNYVLQQLQPDGSYAPAFNLSSSSTPAIVAFLKTLNRTADAYVHVSGLILDGSRMLIVSSISDAYVKPPPAPADPIFNPSPPPASLEVIGWLYDRHCKIVFNMFMYFHVLRQATSIYHHHSLLLFFCYVYFVATSIQVSTVRRALPSTTPMLRRASLITRWPACCWKNAPSQDSSSSSSIPMAAPTQPCTTSA